MHDDSVDGDSGEFVFRGQNAAQFFGKGFVGGGALGGGTQDSSVGPLATSGRAGDGSLVYGTIDIGRRFNIVESGPRFSLSPFIGLNIFQEKITGFTGDEKAITDDSTWTNLRLGGEARLTFCDRITLIADIAILPVAYLSTRNALTSCPLRGPQSKWTTAAPAGLPDRRRSPLRLRAAMVCRRRLPLLVREGHRQRYKGSQRDA